MITFVTGNKNKLKESMEILGTQFEITNQNIDLDEIQGTPQEIAIYKCNLALKAINGPVLVEDSCLGYTAMNGLPGPYVKWFLKSLGPEGLYKLLDGFEDKRGFTLCTVAYAEPGMHPSTFI
ncbi:hypothetical protein HDV01_007536 [Terramyces sp. JEL0728]|nr:hypothetical protein HDV01_007536 [Terramyces sp. JEL0728]